MDTFTIFPKVTVILPCFKQHPSNVTFVLLPKWLNTGARLLSDVVRGLIRQSSDNPLDFHDEIRSVLPIFLKYLYIGWNTK